MSDKGTTTPLRIAVLGASGHLGAFAADALERAPGVSVVRAARRGPTRVDTQRPETFEALRGCAVVLDLSDATSAPPDALAAWCAREGVTFLEATSDAPTMERLLAAPYEGPGLVVLGAGIFTGVSNLLAAAAARSVADARALRWAVASSPYSGAGEGTVALMVDSMGQPVVRYEDGARREEPLARGPSLRFPGGVYPTVRARLAEPAMLHRSTGVPTVDALFAPRPGFLAAAFAAMPRAWLRAGWFRALLRGYFRALRRGLLKWKGSRVEMVATATGADGAARTLALVADDGMRAGGFSAAAMALLLARERPARAGVCCVDEVLALDPVLREGDALAGATLYERRDLP